MSVECSACHGAFTTHPSGLCLSCRPEPRESTQSLVESAQRIAVRLELQALTLASEAFLSGAMSITSAKVPPAEALKIHTQKILTALTEAWSHGCETATVQAAGLIDEKRVRNAKEEYDARVNGNEGEEVTCTAHNAKYIVGKGCPQCIALLPVCCAGCGRLGFLGENGAGVALHWEYQDKRICLACYRDGWHGKRSAPLPFHARIEHDRREGERGVCLECGASGGEECGEARG